MDNSKISIWIWGAGGHGQEMLALCLQEKIIVNGFIDDNKQDHYEGYPVIHSFKLPPNQQVILGIGNPHLRSFVMQNSTLFFPSIISQKAIVNTKLFGKGITICDGSILTTNLTIGNGVLVNIGATVSHRTKIGNYTNICPGAHIAGDCDIGNEVFIGIGSTIIDKIKIGDNSIVAAGSVVTKDIPSNVMVAGIPAKIKKYLEQKPGAIPRLQSWGQAWQEKNDPLL